jgi:hypothetical protein
MALGRGLALLAVSAAVFVGVFSAHQYSNRPIRDTPAEPRRAIFERALVEARSSCAAAGQREQCLNRARALRRFPECDVACAAWANESMQRVAR